MRTLTEVDYLRTDQLSPGLVTLDGLIVNILPTELMKDFYVEFFGDANYFPPDTLHAVIGRVDQAVINNVIVTLTNRQPVPEVATTPAIPKPSDVFPAHK